MDVVVDEQLVLVVSVEGFAEAVHQFYLADVGKELWPVLLLDLRVLHVLPESLPIMIQFLFLLKFSHQFSPILQGIEVVFVYHEVRDILVKHLA